MFCKSVTFDRAQKFQVPILKILLCRVVMRRHKKKLQVLYMMGKYKEVIGFKEDLKTLSFSLREKIGLETIRDLFFSFY